MLESNTKSSVPIDRRNAESVKVSVIIPTFNRNQMLLEAVGSILNQTFRDFEVIVINDGGASVEKDLAGLDSQSKIILLTQTNRQGVAAARNVGLRAARGKYVAFLDDDDIYLPDHLETLVQFLESRRGVVAYTDAYCAFQEPLPEGGYVTSSRRMSDSGDWDSNRILYENFVPTLCFMFERKILDTVGLFDESLTTHEDWDLWIRLSQNHSMSHIKKATCEFRRRKQDGSSMTYSQSSDFERTRRIIFEKYYFLAKNNYQVLKQQRKALASMSSSNCLKDWPWLNRMLRKLISKKLRQSLRKRLAVISLWLED